MNRKKRYIVTYLAGAGIGPELSAETSRALRAVSAMHGFRIDELHAPFGRDAVARYGHPLPELTRDAYRGADAVLIAATREPAVEGVKADLDLTWRVQRVVVPSGGDVAIVSPIVPEGVDRAIGHAFEMARTRRARVALVSETAAFSRRVEELAVDASSNWRDGVLRERLSLAEAMPLLASDPGRFCVLLTEQPFVDALSEMAAFGSDGSRIVASGRLSEHGPGIFGPTHGSAPDIAGQGVANPCAMLLAAALMLGDGFGERAAANTLERAVIDTVARGARTPDLVSTGVAATTRVFVDDLIDRLPAARTDVEFFPAFA